MERRGKDEKGGLKENQRETNRRFFSLKILSFATIYYALLFKFNPFTGVREMNKVFRPFLFPIKVTTFYVPKKKKSDKFTNRYCKNEI